MSLNLLHKPLVGFVILVVGAILALQVSVHNGVRDLERAEIRNCELIKEDRVSNARAWTELEKYLGHASKAVLRKRLRSDTAHSRIIVAEAANQLRLRLLECPPLIRDGKHIIDKRLLHEAQGKL